MMNQNQHVPYEAYTTIYEGHRTSTDVYLERLLQDTKNATIAWHPSRAEVGAVEHRWGGIVVRLKYEIADTRCERFTLSMRRAGDIYASFTMVAQHHSCIEAPDELRDLWRAVQEYIECENADFTSRHIESYIEHSQSKGFSDELSSIVEEACRDIINLVKEQKEK